MLPFVITQPVNSLLDRVGRLADRPLAHPTVRGEHGSLGDLFPILSQPFWHVEQQRTPHRMFDNSAHERDIWLLRMRALLARALGDEAAYRNHRDCYRAMATSLGFEGHMKGAEAMP